jgi:hypothetical protein
MRVQIDAQRLSGGGAVQNLQDFVTWESRELSGGVWRGKRVRAALRSKQARSTPRLPLLLFLPAMIMTGGTNYF